MEYCVNLKDAAVIFLSKLDQQTKTQLQIACLKLKDFPQSKGILLGSLNSGIPFYEKRITSGRGYRIYYSVLPQTVTIDKIIYEGEVPVWMIGNKKSQRKDIQKLKNDY